MYLLTLSEYKSILGVTATTNDTQITALISVVDDAFNRYVFGDSGSFVTATITDVMNGTGNCFLRLRVKPITALTSIAIGFNTPSSVTYAGSDFIFDANKAMVYYNPSSTTSGLPGNFPWGNQNIQVVYTAGYAVADVPQSVKWAAATTIQRQLQLSTASLIANSETLDQYSISYSGTGGSILSQPHNTDMREILDSFKTIRYVF